MKELKPCPYCGGEAEIHERYNSLSKYAENKKEIPLSAKVIRYVKYTGRGGRWEYAEKIYIPRCKDTSCVGRLTKQFTEKDIAIEAWNRRGSSETKEVR